MKRSVPGNRFELESLEQRVLLSGDSLLVGLPTGMPDEPEDPFAADLAVPPSEEVRLFDSDSVQETSSPYSDPYNPADKIDDLFAGLTEENLFDEEVEEGISEETLDSESVADESPQVMLENREITPEAGDAIKQGIEALTDFGRLLEDFDDFGVHLPITKDSSFGGLVGFYEILDTRLKTPVFDYFNDATDPPTTDGLIAALQDIPSTPDLSITVDALSGGYDSASDELRFSLNYHATRKGVVCVQSRPEAAAEGYIFAQPTEADYVAGTTLNFVFGIDLQGGANAFFLEVDQFVAELGIRTDTPDCSATFETAQDPVDATNETVVLDGEVRIQFDESIVGDGRITLSELQGITQETINDCTLVVPTGALFAELPLKGNSDVNLPDVDGPVYSDNVFDPTRFHVNVVPLPAEHGVSLGYGESCCGTGRILGSVSNHGEYSPGNSAGIQNLDTFTQGAEDILVIEIGGLTPGPGDPNLDDGYDQINVSGLATLDGTLHVSLLNNFIPKAGDTFQILTYGSVEGSFAEYTGLSISNELCFIPIQDNEGVNLVVSDTFKEEVLLDPNSSTEDYPGSIISTGSSFFMKEVARGDAALVPGADSGDEPSQPIPSEVEAAIVSGLGSFKNWVAKLETASEFQKTLPVINMSTSELFDFQALLQRLVDPVENYFDTDDTPTIEEFILVLEDLPESLGNVVGDIIANEYIFDLVFQTSEQITTSVDLSGSSEVLDLEISSTTNILLEGVLEIDFSFGFDTSVGTFFIRVDNLSLSAAVNVSELDFDARLGFIDIFINDGAAHLNAGVSASLIDPDNTDGKNYISLPELETTPLNVLISASLSGSASMDLPITSSLMPTVQILTLTWSNVADLTTLVTNIHTMGVYEALESLTTDLLVSGFTDFSSWADNLNASNLFGHVLPLIGEQLAKVIDLPGILQDLLVNKVAFYDTVDSLGANLAAVPGITDVVAELVGEELLYTFELNVQKEKAVEFIWSLDSLLNLDLFIPDLTLSMDVSGKLCVGVDLATMTPTFFLATDDINPELNVKASIDVLVIDASGSIGFLEVIVSGGSTHIFAELSVDLFEPSGSGRIIISDFTGFVGNMNDYAQLELNGSASLSLPLSSPLLPEIGTQTLNTQWLDITNPGTFTTNAAEILGFDSFEAIAAHAFSFGLDQLSTFMAQLAQQELAGSNLLRRKLPLIGKSLSEMIDFKSVFVNALSSATTLQTDPETGLTFTPFANSRELLLLLEAIPGVTFVTSEVTAEDIRYHVHYETTLNNIYPLLLNFEKEIIDLDLSANINVQLDIVLDVTFGVSADSGLFFIEEYAPGNANFIAEGSVSADINTDARLGFLDINVEGGPAAMAAGLAIRLLDPHTDDEVAIDPLRGFDPPPSPGKITITELQRDNGTLLAEVTLSGDGRISLPVSASLGQWSESGTLEVSWADITEPDIFVLDASDIPGIFNFNVLTVDSVLEGLRMLPELLSHLAGEGSLGIDLPFIGANLKKVIHVGEQLQGFLDSLASFSTVQGLQTALENALGTAIQTIVGSLDVRFAIDFEDTFDENLDYNLDESVGGFGFQISGSHRATGSVNVDLEFGVSFDPDLALQDRFYLVAGGESLVEMAFQMLTDDPITATATLGLLSLGIQNGSITVAGRTSGTIDPTKNATAIVSLVDLAIGAADGKITLGEILTDPLSVLGTPLFDGAIEVVLPLTPIPFVTPAEDNPSIRIEWSDIADPGTLVVTYEDLDSYFAGATDFNFDTALDGIRAILEMIEQWSDEEILNYQLPLLDITIAEIFDYVAKASSFFEAIIGADPVTEFSFDQAVQDAIIAAGLDPEMVTLTPSEDPAMHDVENKRFFYNLSFNYDLLSDPVSFGFALGGDIFTLDVSLHPQITFDFDLQFGLNPDDGFFIRDTGPADAPEMTLTASLIAEFNQIGGNFGPLIYGVSDGSASLDMVLEVDLIDPSGPERGGNISASELMANLFTVIDPSIHGHASIVLSLGLRLGDAGPAVTTTFSAAWDSSDPTRFTFGPAGSANPVDGFGPVLFELGEFMHNILRPVLEKINDINPLLQDMIDILNTELPILKITPLDVISHIIDSPQIGLLFNILGIVDDFFYLFEGHAIDLTSYFENETSPANPGPGSETLESSNDYGFFQEILNRLKDDYNLLLPFLDDVRGSIINTLLGREIDLIRWDPPAFNVGKDDSYSFPLWYFGIPFLLDVSLEAFVGGGFGFFGDIDLGLSTRGLLTSGDLLDGFFFGDNISGGNDPFELGFYAEVYMGASGKARVLGIDLVEVWAKGGLHGELGIDISDLDPDTALEPWERVISRHEPWRGDNRIYGDEIEFFLPDKLECLLRVGGSVNGFLEAGAKLESELGENILDEYFYKDFPIADWDYPCNNYISTTLATQSGSTLTMLPTDASEPGKMIYAVIRMDAEGNPLGMRLIKQDIVSGYKKREYQDFSMAELATIDTLALVGTNKEDIITVAPEIARYVKHIHVDSLGGNDLVDFGDYSNEGSIMLIDTTIDAGPGNDQVFGAPVANYIYGGAGNDELFGGMGVGGRLYGEEGDDRIFGADDNTLFGDIIEGGKGADSIWGLGGADFIRGGEGIDIIDGGCGNDLIFGEEGGDTLYGALGDDILFGHNDSGDGDDDSIDYLYGENGNDLLYGQGGDDYIDGGFGTDTLFGEAGDDELHAGNGAGNELNGGQGNDIVYGADDGADVIYGNAGHDRIFGYKGNDSVSGGPGDDIIDDGAGDDIIEGDEGSDLLVGSYDHDILYGHNEDGTGDDNAVDYLYGDLAGLGDDPGAGQDQLFGGGGNDLLFGERNDDFIDGGLGISDLVDYGEPDDGPEFVPPLPTLAPELQSPDMINPRSLVSLPGTQDDRGRWAEFGGSATGTGLCDDPGLSIEPHIAVDDMGKQYIVWSDSRNGNFEIYVARHMPNHWGQLAFSAEQGGVSNTPGSSRRPCIAFNGSGKPLVAWTEFHDAGSDINVVQFDPEAHDNQGAWEAIGNSMDQGGISGTGAADHAIIAYTEYGPVIGWLDSSQGTTQVYVKYFTGTSWEALGEGDATDQGVTNAPSDVLEFSLVTDGKKIAIAWIHDVSGTKRVNVIEYQGEQWISLEGSISGSPFDSRAPTLAYHNGVLFVTWEQITDSLSMGREIYACFFDGVTGSWQPAGPQANIHGGISESEGSATKPHLACGGGRLRLVWVESRIHTGQGQHNVLYSKVWDGTQFYEEVRGDAEGYGISKTGTEPASLSLAVDKYGHPFVVWEDWGDDTSRVYVRGNTFNISELTGHGIFSGESSLTLQSILNNYDLDKGDVIYLNPGSYLEPLTISDDDAGVLIVGSAGLQTTINGHLLIDNADEVTVQRIDLAGGVTIINSDGVTIRESSIGGTGVAIEGGAHLQITHNTINGETTGIDFSGISGSTDTDEVIEDIYIAYNEIGGTTAGVSLFCEMSGLINKNDIAASSTGILIESDFTGSIIDNKIHSASIGIGYNAAASLSGNHIFDNSIGVTATVDNEGDGFGFVGEAEPNHIYKNTTGVHLSGRMHNQHIYNNEVGVSGDGVLGGDDLAKANLIEGNTTGVQDFEGVIQYNRISGNITGLMPSRIKRYSITSSTAILRRHSVLIL